MSHPDRQLFLNDEQIRPRDFIAEQKSLRKFSVTHAGEEYRVGVQVIHWDTGQEHREAFLCSPSGMPLHRLADSFLGPATKGSVFIKSELFEELHEENLLSTFESSVDKERSEILANVRSRIRKHFRQRQQANAEDTLERLRKEGSYPYQRPPQTDIDRIEQRVFDMCTIKIRRHLPTFDEGTDVAGRTLLLRMVQEALSQNPSSVGRIIREVCKLPSKDADKFAELLDDIPLSSFVNAAHQVAQRLEFLKSFKAIVYLNPFDRVIKERTELQRLLVPNTWLFGEQYALGTDDQNFKAVLEKHISILGRDDLQPAIKQQDLRKILSEYNKDQKSTPISLERIPDIMLWRQFKERRPDEFEFLVIELKRPGVSIGRDEHGQIEDYARAVTSTPFADTERTQWVFIVVSDRLHPEIEERAHQSNLPSYTTSRPSHGKYEIRAYPWNVLIQSAEGRHEHLRQWLDHNVSVEKALERTTAAYSEILPPDSTKKRTRRRRQSSAARRTESPKRRKR